MRQKLRKPVESQVIVITGAASGIGLATADMAAAHGASVVLSDFNRPALDEAAAQFHKNGYDVRAVVADVSHPEDMKHLARETIKTYGRIDTWVNNAGTHIFGRAEDVKTEDAKRVFAVDYWGVVHGCRAAVPYLTSSQGTLINVGSVLSSQSVPLQSYYGASKHAVKAYTDTLRMELAAQGSPIAVSLIQPSAIDTPISMHSKNYMDYRVRLPVPLYHPSVVANAIVSCAEHPRRSVTIGAVGKLGMFGEKYASYWAQVITKLALYRMQKAKGPKRDEDGLHTPVEGPPQMRSDDKYFALHSSAYTWVSLHPLKAAIGAGAALATGRFLLKQRGL